MILVGRPLFGCLSTRLWNSPAKIHQKRRSSRRHTTNLTKELWTLHLPQRHIPSVCALLRDSSHQGSGIDIDSALSLCALTEVICSHSDVRPSLAWMDTFPYYTDTMHLDTTINIDHVQAAVTNCSNPSAHSRLRSVFGHFAEGASPTSHESNEKFGNIRQCRTILKWAQYHLHQLVQWH